MGDQDLFLRNAVFQTSKPATLAVTGREGEASIFDKLQDHLDHVIIRKKSQQIAGEAAVLDSVISCCQVEKHGSDLLLCMKKVLNILKSSLLSKQQWIYNEFHTGVDKPLEDLVGFKKKRYCGIKLKIPSQASLVLVLRLSLLFSKFWEF